MFTIKPKNNLAKTLSGLALALMFCNVSHAGIVRYNYSFSDSSNTVTADFSIDDTKAINNLISGTFTFNGTSYIADAANSDGLYDASRFGPAFTGTIIELETTNANSPYSLNIDNYAFSSGSAVFPVKNINLKLSSFPVVSLFGSVGTLTVVPTVSAVPVPAAAWLFGSGLVGLAGLRRRKQAV